MSNYYSPAENEKTEKKSAVKVEKIIKSILIVAGMVLAAQLIWLFVVTPFIPFSNIEVEGIPGFNRAEILAFSGIDENSSYFSTNAKNAQKLLSGHILVESATVLKRFPDKLSIFLTPREAAAITLANMGSRQVPLYIDRQGVFFKIGQEEEVSSLPIISGIENPRLNMRLPNALVPLVDNLYQMTSTAPELLSAISEIRIERKAWDGYDLVLFPVHGSTRVRVEKNITEDVLRYMLLMLNVFEGDSNKPREIDFRSGMGSYSIKELTS